MKASSGTRIFLALLLLVTQLGLVQTPAQTPVNCDDLRGKIERIEKTDLNTMSPSLRQAFKESLLTLYAQFSRCLDQDISAATGMKNNFAGTDAASAADAKLQALIKEKGDTDSKITLLKTNLDLADATVPVVPPKSFVTRRATESAKSGAVTATQPSFSCEPGESYDDAPELLTDIVEKAAFDVVSQNNNAQALSAGVPQMLLYTIMDASSPSSSRAIHGLKAYQYLSETARTDKQLGASAKSEGAVSAIEKPGFARLLGFAVEHGGITKKNDGTNLTLSTSLYSLYTLNSPDTTETYARAGILNRIGVSATFAVDNKTNELANARRNNLSEWSVKARLFGDRSTRSSRFQRFWDEKVRPLISARLQALGGAMNGLSDEIEIPNSNYDLFENDMTDCLEAAVTKRMGLSDYKTASPEQQKVILTNFMVAHLKKNVFDRVKTGQLKLSDKGIKNIELEYLPKLKTALDDLVKANGELAKMLDDLNKSPLGTFGYTNYRTPTGSDYSEAKFLFEQDKSFLRPLKLTGNFGLSFYNKPDPSLKQQTLRDVSGALSFDGTTRSPFTEAENQSKITYSFVGRYERLFENRRMANRKPDIGTFQFVMEIPFFKGLSLPLSASYANATEQEKKTGFRFNFGMRLDTDKLFELLKAASSH